MTRIQNTHVSMSEHTPQKNITTKTNSAKLEITIYEEVTGFILI